MPTTNVVIPNMVKGPASATDEAFAQYDGTTGKLLKDGVTASDGGNGASDGGKLVKFKSTGAIEGRCDLTFGVMGRTNAGVGVIGTALTSGIGVQALSAENLGADIQTQASGQDIAFFGNSADEDYLYIKSDGGLFWNNSTGNGPATTRTNLGLGALAIADVPVTVSAFAGTEVLANGALGYDTTTDALIVGDGVTNITNLLLNGDRVYYSAQSVLTLVGAKEDVLSGASLSSATVSGSDKVLIQDADDSDNLKTVTAQSIADLAAGGGSSMTLDVAQASHGLSVGDVVRHNGTGYVDAQADSAANAEVVGIVSAVADASNFTLHVGGVITTLSGLTAGTTYFLDPSTAGAYTATEPSTVGQVSKPLFTAVSTTAAIWTNYRGIVIV